MRSTNTTNNYSSIKIKRLHFAALLVCFTVFLSLLSLNNASFAFRGSQTTGRFALRPVSSNNFDSFTATKAACIGITPIGKRTSQCIVRFAVSKGGAKEVFSLIDTDGNGRIDEKELRQVLKLLDLEATNEDVSILFRHLDKDGSKEIDYNEFQSWYFSASASVQREINVVMDALLQRRTVNNFDTSPVPDSVLYRAVKAAIAAPCHGLSEPWRFIKLGEKTISEIATLNAADLAKKDPTKAEEKRKRWTAIPGWCVVTSAKSPTESDGLKEKEDYAATCCAIQNFMLAMWAEGVGTKWTTGPVTRTDQFAKLCGIDLTKEQVVGCIWYGFASGGLASVPAPLRKRGVDDVLSTRP